MSTRTTVPAEGPRRFEVSARTVKRDVSALQQAGFPVWSRPGRLGGYVVDREATLPSVNLSAGELSGLAAAVAAHRGQPFEHHARTALLELLSVMTPGGRERATTLAERVWVDRPSDGAGDGSVRRVVEQALVERRVLSVTAQQAREVTTTLVHPQLLAHTEDRWFLAATAEPSGGVQWFALDTIQAATLTRRAAGAVPVRALGTPPASASAVVDRLVE